jgi:hypothetical protein
MVLHPDCHGDPASFYNLHGFFSGQSQKEVGTPIAAQPGKRG